MLHVQINLFNFFHVRYLYRHLEMLSNISVIFDYFENSCSPNSEIHVYDTENNSNFVSPN